ncbi:hypothetical protein ABZV93_27185 [Actinopolymorpha sp. NPDC004070]|uniref:hypothetical protein n=1 Tax=Actinopolymorpha sp. NPDC004070 TaxID=3154548 RepID=UPI0033A80CC2
MFYNQVTGAARTQQHYSSQARRENAYGSKGQTSLIPAIVDVGRQTRRLDMEREKPYDVTRSPSQRDM